MRGPEGAPVQQCTGATRRYGERVTVILPSRRRNYGPQISALARVQVLEHPELSSQAFTDAGVQSARALAVVWQDDVGNLHAGLRATELNPGLRLVLAVADGTPRNPLTRRRNPARAAAGLFRRLVWHKFGLVFAALKAVIGAGFWLLATRYAFANAVYLALIYLTGSALTSPIDSGRRRPRKSC